jgi:hypothetical protein
MSKSDTEPAIVDRATNLEQQIGAISWALVHSVDGRRDDPSPGPLCDDALATDGFRTSGRQHSVQGRHTDSSLGLLGSKAADS